MTRLRSRFLWLGLVVVALGLGYALAPYLLPTTVALGPCGKDWTSPSSFLPRSSPTRDMAFREEGVGVKVCYGSPAVKGREIFGSLVPWGKLWRMGANEPTRIFVDGPVDLGGIALAPGRYSLYAEPGPDEWRVMVSESTFHWGNAITTDVRARELGSVAVTPAELDESVENLRFQWRPGQGEGRGALEMDWASTRVAIPLHLNPGG
jgi:hypothetical protein